MAISPYIPRIITSADKLPDGLIDQYRHWLSRHLADLVKPADMPRMDSGLIQFFVVTSANSLPHGLFKK